MASLLEVDRSAQASDAPGFRRMFAPGKLTLGVFMIVVICRVITRFSSYPSLFSKIAKERAPHRS